jgi:hypothetical protein
MLPLFILLFRRFMLRKKNVPDELFSEALVTYERALGEAKKIGFQGNNLKSKIIEKLKVLHTVIAYKNGFHPGR